MTKGERYKIYNHTISANQITEGIASLVRCNGFRISRHPETDGQWWEVRFDNEPDETYERLVFSKDAVK